MTFNPRWIIGKTVAAVEMRPFDADDHTRRKAHDPKIIFTDGSSITFNTEETERGEYGVDVLYWAAP